MADALSAGPTTVLLLGTHTNLALLLTTRPHLRRNVERVYVSGGAVRAEGNLFTSFATNPVAEFNVFGDPFAAYEVLHSGVPVTMVPLDATNTIPVTEEFFDVFRRRQSTYEAQYCFQSLDAVLSRQGSTASLNSSSISNPCKTLHCSPCFTYAACFSSSLVGWCRATTCGTPSPPAWLSPACATARSTAGTISPSSST
jgi:inosine-uridine nucleoside N-ribohydrolase